MLTRKGWSIWRRISFSSWMFSIYSFSKIMSFLMHFIAYSFCVVACFTRKTLPKVPLPIILTILNSSSDAGCD